MALGDLEIDSEREQRRMLADIKSFEDLLREAAGTPWWNCFVESVTQRRNAFVTNLCEGGLDKPAEDMLRGRIQEDTFILALDNKAKQLEEEKNGRARRRADS